MHIGPRKIFPSANCVIAKSLDGGELGYRPIRIFVAVNEINKVHIGASDNLVFGE